MTVRKKRLPPDVKLIVEDWHRRIRNRPFLVGQKLRVAMVAQCVIYLMSVRAELRPDRPIGDYISLYDQACEALDPYMETL